MTGFPKGIPGQHVFNCSNRFFNRLRDDNAFTGSQTISFHNDRRATL
jgi:hypothetical protein